MSFHHRLSRLAAVAALITVTVARAAAPQAKPQPGHPRPAALASVRSAESQLVVPSPERTAYLLSYWLVEVKRALPGADARIEVTDAEASADALLRGRAPLVVLTRPLSAEETEAFAGRFGYRPTGVRVARDALRVYVNSANPLAGVTLDQLDAVFSATRLCGRPEDLFWWDQLGLDGEWKLRQIELYGPSAQSGARSVFAARVLCDGTHKATLEMAPNSRDLMTLVARNRAAIAYGDAETTEAGVRELPVAAHRGEPFVAANDDSIRSRRYPLVREVYVYLNRKPGAALGSTEAALVEFALSSLGRSRAESAGFVPLEAAEAGAEASKLR